MTLDIMFSPYFAEDEDCIMKWNAVNAATVIYDVVIAVSFLSCNLWNLLLIEYNYVTIPFIFVANLAIVEN